MSSFQNLYGQPERAKSTNPLVVKGEGKEAIPHSEYEKYKTKQIKTQYGEAWEEVKEYFQGVREEWNHRGRTYKWHDWVGEVIPAVNWLKIYNLRQNFPADFIAGISIGVMVVPQAVSYANTAGLPPQYGLYGSFLPVIVYGLFGSSRHLVVGPVAVTSNLIASSLVKLVPGQKDNVSSRQYSPQNPRNPRAQNDYNILVEQVTFVVAIAYTLVGVLRLGWVVYFLSHATVSGFMTGAALQILLQQVQYIGGYSVPSGESYKVIGNIFKNIRGFVWQEFIMGMIFIAILVTYRELSNRYKWAKVFKVLGPVTVLIIGIIVVGAGKRTGTVTDKGPLKLVGKFPAGPPKFTGRRIFPMPRFQEILPTAIVVTAIDFTESNSIATALSIKGRYKLQYNKEIVGLGLANIMGALFNSYTTTGSFSRSAVNYSVGGKTQISPIISAIIVMFVLLFLTRMFLFVPYNAIGAIIIVGVSNLIEPQRAWYYFRVNFFDFLQWIAAFLVTFFAGVEYGLLAAVAVAGLTVCYYVVFPRVSQLGQVGDTPIYRGIDQYPDQVHAMEDIKIFRVEAALHFANSSNVRDTMRAVLERKGPKKIGPIRFLILDLISSWRIDTTGLEMLENFKDEMEMQGIRFVLANPQEHVWKSMESAHTADVFGREWIFASVHDAVQYCKLYREEEKENEKLKDIESNDNQKKPPKDSRPQNKKLDKWVQWYKDTAPGKFLKKEQPTVYT